MLKEEKVCGGVGDVEKKNRRGRGIRAIRRIGRKGVVKQKEQYKQEE